MRPLTPKFIWLLPAFGFLLFGLNTSAQIAPCGSDQIHEQLLTTEPVYAQRMSQATTKYQQFLTEKAAKKGGPDKSVTTTYTIPVVVHIIYTSVNATNNISDAQVQSAIQRMNEQYSNAFGTSVDTKIQFQLATMDENCNPTTGILHVSGANLANYTSHGIDGEVYDTDGIGASMSGVFGLSRWDPDLYMNIYVVSEINNNGGGFGTQAYAFYPNANDAYHGVVILYNTIGYDYNNCGCYQLKSYTDENETLAHEVGHYFYLKHTFEGGNSSVCPSLSGAAGDGVADTPAHKYISYCPTSGGNSCYASTDPFYDWDKIIHNYMGYWGESCTDEFTQGQADRMAWAIETYKPGLQFSTGLQSSSVSMVAAECTPQTTTGLGSEFGLGPVEVTIGDMTASSNSAFKDGGYLSRSCFSANLEINQTYPFGITFWGNYTEDARVYIDWNNDGSLADSELVFTGDNAKSFSGSFTVPTTAVTGQRLRARVISDLASNTINGSCYAPEYGQVEDYPVFVKNLNPVLTSSVNLLSNFITKTTVASASQNFKISGTDLVNDVKLTCSGNAFELSSDSSSYASTLSFTPNSLVLSEKTVYVRLKSGLSIGAKTATLTVSHSGATSKTVSLSGEVGGVSKLRGNCVSLDGWGDYIQTNFKAISGGQSRTCEAWVKTTANNAAILSFGSLSNYKKWTFGIDSSGRLRIEIENAHKVSTNSITDGNWHHVAVVLDNNNGATLANTTLYIDGKVETPSDLLNANMTINTDSATSMTIGKDLNERFFTGKMDEVRIWTTARSGTEIRSNMHLTLDGTESGLAAYCQFNEGNGMSIYSKYDSYAAAMLGNGSMVASTVNCGREGISQTLTSIASAGVQAFSDAHFNIDFLEKTGADDFTATYQQFAPNSTSGMGDGNAFNNPVWTVNRSSSGSFLGNFTFTFPYNTLTETDPLKYSLYHRSMGDDGDWELLSAMCTELSGSSITFDSISVAGQFMVAQMGIPSERGHAIQLDGVDDELRSELNFDPLTEPFTVELWAKLDGNSQIVQTILEKSRSDNNSYLLIITLQNRLWVYFGNRLIETKTITLLDRNDWNHIAFVWDLQTAKLYLNGMVIAESGITGIPSNTNPLNFGTQYRQRYHFSGQMDEIRYWSEARSQQEILEGMHLSSLAKISDDAQYFQLNRTASAFSGWTSLNLVGSPSYTSSGVNVGEEGTAQTISNLATTGIYDVDDVQLSMNLTEFEDSLSFTAVYQGFAPNTVQGVWGSKPFNAPTWTLHETTGHGFAADLTFIFPTDTFSDLTANKYQLYHRSAGSDGAWSLLVDGADSLNNNSIKFNGISEIGQFMVAKRLTP